MYRIWQHIVTVQKTTPAVFYKNQLNNTRQVGLVSDLILYCNFFVSDLSLLSDSIYFFYTETLLTSQSCRYLLWGPPSPTSRACSLWWLTVTQGGWGRRCTLTVGGWTRSVMSPRRPRRGRAGEREGAGDRIKGARWRQSHLWMRSASTSPSWTTVWRGWQGHWQRPRRQYTSPARSSTSCNSTIKTFSNSYDDNESDQLW